MSSGGDESFAKRQAYDKKNAPYDKGGYMEEVKFSTQVGVKDMYRFMMHHAYIGVSGVVNLVISGGAFVLLVTGAGEGSAFNNALLILIACMFTIINPILLFYKSAKQVKLTPMFQKPLEYVANEEAIVVSQSGEQLALNWKDVRKVVETGSAIYLYLSLTRAYIIPKENLGENLNGFKALVRDHVEKKACKLKR